MMKKKALIVILSIMMILTMTQWDVYASEKEEPNGLLQANTVQLDTNSKIRHEVCDSLSDAAREYYTGDYSYSSLEELPGASDDSDSYLAMQNNPLYDKLQGLMQTTMDKQSIPAYGGYAEGSLAYYWNFTDTSPVVDNTKSSHFLMFYSDAKYEYPGANYSMNREHVWPKSHASFYETNGGSDLHHLRPSVKEVNDAKSDHIFGYVDEVYKSGYGVGELDGKEAYKVYPDKDVFEPKDDVKGDIARILLYVYCCWGQPNLYSDVSADKLPAFDPDDTTNYGGRVVSDLDTLLTWCADDPVDTWEMERNDLTQIVQGNRNVFIDYPELAWKMFGRSIPAGMQTPTNTGCSHVYGDPVISYDSCLEPGTLTEICSVCGNIHTLPSPITGHIDENNDSRCDRCNALILGEFHAADSVTAGDHIIMYHPASGNAITPVVNSKSQLNGTEAVDNEGIMIPTEDTAVFYVEDAGEGSVHLIRNGKYLTTTRSGGRLLWTDQEDDSYITWTLRPTGDGGLYIVNAVAGSQTKPYAVEYFNNSFTTYALAEDNAAFIYKLFSIPDHVWDETSRKEPTCTEPGKAELKCAACGAEEERDIEAVDHGWDEPTYTWADDNSAVTATRTCRNDASHVETETVNTTSEVTTEPTADKDGVKTYTAKFTNPAFETQTKPESIPAAGQEEPSDPVVTKFTISYDLNGGTLDGKTGIISVQAEKGSTITIPAAPTREGYKFTYWKGSEYYPGDSYKVEGDHTFTAQWEKNESSSGDETSDDGKKDDTSESDTTTKDKEESTAATDESSPKTGDESHMTLWGSLMAASLPGLFLAFSLRKRYRKERQE